MTDRDQAKDSAARRAHGTHGKGRNGEEQRIDDAEIQPGSADDSDRGGSAGWGSESSGGSVVDKRPPK